MACLHSLGIEVSIDSTPDEFDDRTPFNEDTHHASYETSHVESFRRILVGMDRIVKSFRSRFIGKCSPVQFFWNSFDLAVTRFSGRRAPLPADVDPLTREAYSHEVISCGFWPGDRKFPHAALYSYTKPAPIGLEKERVRPSAAHWDAHLGEFLLRTAQSAEQARRLPIGIVRSSNAVHNAEA